VQGRKDAPPEWSRRYEYSAEAYLLAAHDSARGTTRYQHDAGHRLIAEHAPGVPSRKFVHDGAGNLLFSGAGYGLYQGGNVLAEANGRRFDHDLRHAVSTESWQGGYRRFHRDERDQLVRVEPFRAVPMDGTNGGLRWMPGPVWTARYDALNRRVDKTVAGQTTTFYWDSDRLAAEIQSGGALRVYVYADALAMTPLLFVDYASVDAAPESGVVYAVYGDHLGCPERIEDMTGQVVWSGILAPYGALEITAGAAFHQPLRWPGHYWDAELGLQYNRFRTYAPELGRYLEPDPLGRGGGIENVYAYTENPLFLVDIDGQCAKKRAEEAARKRRAAEEKSDDEPVEVLDVGAYGKLTKRSVPGDELQNDHIPSFAACAAAAEEHLGRSLTSAEETNLRNALTAITEPNAVHRGDSRTYGGRNNSDQIEQDSGNLQAAAKKDMAAVRQGLIDDGNSPKAVDGALKSVDQRNVDNGLYDPATLAKIAEG